MMVKEMNVTTIEVDPKSQLAKALSLAEKQTVVLVSNGVRFTVTRATDDDLWADYDPERVRAALREAAGTLTPEEGDRLKEILYRGREEGTRPIDRP
jgi:hypothetical protein